MVLGVPIVSNALPDIPAEAVEAQADATMLQGVEIGEPELEISGNAVSVKNAQGQRLEVYDVTGKRVLSVYIDSNDKTLTLNLRKGCYILRVGKLTRKVALS